MTNDDKLRDYLKRVTVDLHEVRSRLHEVEHQSSEPLAIVGIGCRFPGGVGSAEELWELVRDGRDVISDCPTDRGWDIERLYDPEPGRPGTTYVREGGFLYDVAGFDTDFFSISPREALAMDPQQRLLLEASWEAIESAGVKPVSLQGSQTGVFVGGATNGYGLGLSGSMPEDIAGHYGSGTLSSVMSGRVSYTFGLEGPAVTIDTACSSSLVAVHTACRSLRAGEISLALVGGVCVMPTPTVFLELSRQRALAPDGRCKSFAEDADGVGWGEGVGVLMLERISDARRLGHSVLAVIRGSAVNQDGASNGLTAPNGPSQRRVIRAALADAKLSAHQVDAVEAHGTGTTLGDPIEAQALLATYGQSRPAARPLWLGSIKSNIGHTQAAAGVAGVIKMVMAMQHGLLPKTLHVDRPSQKVDWSSGSVSLLVEAVPWPETSEPRRAGVSSFGISGTNAHVIVEEAPRLHEPRADNGHEDTLAAADASPRTGDASPRTGDAPPQTGDAPARTGLLGEGTVALVLAGRNEVSLRGQAGRMSAFLKDHPKLDLRDVGLSLAKRSRFDRRAVAIGCEQQDLSAQLESFAREAPDADVIQGTVSPTGAGRVVFVFPGQGSQWAGMALELLDSSPAFARRFGECCGALAPFIDWSVEDVLRGVEGAPDLERIEVVQPVLFAVMVALAGLWEACGVRPDVVVGHSQGEIAAAHVAGGLSLGDAARIVALRSQMLTALVGHSGVVSVALGVEQARERLARWDGRLVVAGVNGPRSVGIAGDDDALRELLDECDAEGVRARAVPATVASHSSLVEPFHKQLLEALSVIEPRSGDISFYSTVTGGLLDTAQLDAAYWYRNLREPVEFERVTRALLGEGCDTFIEVSAHPVLAVAVQETVEDAAAHDAQAGADEHGWTVEAQLLARAGALGSLRRGDGGPRRFLASLGEAWVRGVKVDWDTVFGETGATTMPLPTYAFQRRRYWLETPPGMGDASMVGQMPVGHPLVGAAVALAEGDGWLFTGRVSLHDQPWFADHALAGSVVVPGTTFVDMSLRVGAQVGCDLLEDLVFETPLVLPHERGAAQLQLALGSPDGNGKRAVGIFTRSEDTQPGADGTWTRHARGVLAPIEPASTNGISPGRDAGPPATEPWPPSGAEPVAVSDVYDYFAGVGLEYGPAFLSVQAAWQRGHEAFTEVRLPESERERAHQFSIHPALLDCALQSAGMLMRDDWDLTEHGALPFAWAGVRLHVAGASLLRVHVSQLAAGGYSMVASDEAGRPVLSADSVVMRKVSPETLRIIRGANRDLMFDVEWTAVDTGESAAMPSPEDWATLGDDQPHGGSSRTEADHDRPTVYSDLKSLIRAIDAGARVPEVVLARFDAEGLAPPGLLAASRRVLEWAVSLVQTWLADERLQSSRLVFVTKGAVSVGGYEGTLDLAVAPLWGLLRSVQSENPERFVLVDLDGDDELGALAIALGSGEPQVAWRGSTALAPRLGRVTVEPGVADIAQAGDQQPGSQPSDVEGGHQVSEIGLHASGQAGSVLITGGTGTLGAALARHLVERRGVRSVVLVSRQGPLAPGVERLEADLVELGAGVRVLACDVSDREQLARVLTSVPSEYPLSAVVHAAGALEDGVIDSMTPERIDRVLSPKLDGAWHLHELTQELDLSAFILFSSSTATIGGPGQSNYAAANAFLDALAAHRRQQGLCGISMAWGLWESTEGMARDLTAADRARMERGGMLALTIEEGLRLFDVAYATDTSFLLPARLNLAALQAQARGGVVPPLLRGLIRMPADGSVQSSGPSLRSRLANTPERERGRVVLDLVRAEVAAVLGHPSSEAVDAHRAFNELGFDSLTAVELRNRLGALSGIRLPVTLAFDYPSPAALSEFLLERLSPEDGSGSEPGEQDIRGAIAAIPLARLREAGVMDTLMQLAGLAHGAASEDEGLEEDLDELDVESLVEMSLAGKDAPSEHEELD